MAPVFGRACPSKRTLQNVPTPFLQWGRLYIGAPMGTSTFTQQFMASKLSDDVRNWKAFPGALSTSLMQHRLLLPWPCNETDFLVQDSS